MAPPPFLWVAKQTQGVRSAEGLPGRVASFDDVSAPVAISESVTSGRDSVRLDL